MFVSHCKNCNLPHSTCRTRRRKHLVRGWHQSDVCSERGEDEVVTIEKNRKVRLKMEVLARMVRWCW